MLEKQFRLCQEGHGWDICDKDSSIELRDRHRDLFTIVSKVNNIYPVELKAIALRAEMAAWMDDRWHMELTHQDIVECLDGHCHA